MNPTLKVMSRTALALVSGVVCIALSGCGTIQRTVHVRYTPLVEAKRIADATHPQTVIVGDFVDARARTNLSRGRRPQRFTHFEFDAAGDVPSVVRSAFVDGLLKSGFEVPMPNESGASPLFQLTGKVVTYDVLTVVGWTKGSLESNVGVELTITPRTGPPFSLAIQGQASTGFVSTADDSAIAGSLDAALRDCVHRFLTDSRFLQLLRK